MKSFETVIFRSYQYNIDLILLSIYHNIYAINYLKLPIFIVTGIIKTSVAFKKVKSMLKINRIRY